jgi:sulfonate transport system permease protein
MVAVHADHPARRSAQHPARAALFLIVAETIAADAGIGYMATHAREFMHMDVVVLCVLIYALLGKLSDWIAKILERRWLKWHHNFSAQP